MPSRTRHEDLAHDASEIAKARAPRQTARKVEIAQADKEFPRTVTKNGPVAGDKSTDCIYVITIDGRKAYVGQTNSFETRKRQHQHLSGIIAKMQKLNPEATIEMRRVHGGARDGQEQPDCNAIIAQHGAQLHVMEGLFMHMFDTLAQGDYPRGVGSNKYRWNEKGETKTANGKAISEADRKRLIHLHVCDGPSTETCDGNIIFTQRNIDAMIEGVEASFAVDAVVQKLME